MQRLLGFRKLTIWHEFVRCFLEQLLCYCELMNHEAHMSLSSWQLLARVLTPQCIHLGIIGIRKSYVTASSWIAKSRESRLCGH
jgi:hypothetical protein